MKRFFVCALILFSISTAVFAMDWGGVFKNSTSANIPQPNSSEDFFTQSNSIYAWVSVPFSRDNKINFKAEGMYGYYFYAPSKAFVNIVDLDLFKFSADIETDSGDMSIYAGRFQFLDLSNVVFAQNSDGLFFEYSNLFLKTNIYAGYTGLLNTKNVSMLNESGSVIAAQNDFYAIGASYIPLFATVSLPSLFGNQSLGLQTSAFFDVSSAENKYNRFYAALSFGGPIVGNLFYSLTTDFGSENFKNLMNYSSLGLKFYPVANISLGAGAEYASGNHLCFSSFRGFSSRVIYSAAYDGQTSGCIVPYLNASFALLNNSLFIDVFGKFVMVCPEKSLGFEGFQADANFAYNVFSDLQLSLALSAFFGSAEKNNSKYSATFKFAFAF